MFLFMPSDGEWLFERVQEQLRHEWEEYRELYAQNKGSTYEESFANLLTSYFGGVYDIHTKAAVIDSESMSFEIFDFIHGEDELDVLATFSQAKPRVVFETGEGKGELRWVPLESVAFFCEIKSQLTKQAIEDDFEKLNKISRLTETLDGRFGPMIGGDLTISDPLRCLVYDRESISVDTLSDILQNHLSDWHLLLIVENDVLLLNRNIPLAENFVPSSQMFGTDEMPEIPDEALSYIQERTDIDVDPDIITMKNGLFMFLLTMAATIPDPLSVNTANSLQAISDGFTFNTSVKTEFEDEF